MLYTPRCALSLLGLLLCSCATAPAAETPEVPAATVSDRLRSFFPHAAFDDRCSYARPIGPNESVARYSADIDQQPGRPTDLDCLVPGRPERPARTGMAASYYYANSFLLLRATGVEPLGDLRSFIRASGLDSVPATGEIYYLLAIYSGESGLFDCSRRLAMAAARSGILEARSYWRALEDLRERPPGPNEQTCTDPTFLTLLPPELR